MLSRGVTVGFPTGPAARRRAYQVQGPRDAPPLLLLQGQGNAHGWWERLREPSPRAISRSPSTIAGPGPGSTAGRVTTASFADDAVAVLDDLGLDTVAVYGTSMGGRIAQMLAIHHPERLSRLVLACTTPGGPHAIERGQDVRRALATTGPRCSKRRAHPGS